LDLFAGEGLLGVGGFVDGEGVVAEAVDLVDLFEADDGESGGFEDVLAGVLGGAGLALGGAGSGGEFGVFAVGGDDGKGGSMFGSWHRLTVFRNTRRG